MGKTFAVLLTLLLGKGIAAAEPITIVTDGRTVSAFAQLDVAGQTDQRMASQGPGDSLNASATAAIGTNAAHGMATLLSSIADPSALSGTGHALAAFFTADRGQASAVSRFSVGFMLDQPFVYTFDGAFAVSDFPINPPSNGFREASWSAVLSSGSSFFINASDTKPALLHDSGVLPAGSYLLNVDTSGSGFLERGGTVDEDSGFNFNLGLTPLSETPEPASLTLLVTGIAALVTAKTRERRRSRSDT